MVDWPGLLKWSTQFHDTELSSEQKSQFTPMDKERREWLTEALKAYQFDEANQMQQIITSLKQHQDDKETLLSLLDNLDQVLEGLSNALDFCTLGGMALLLEMLQTSPFPEVRANSSLIVAVCAQNNVDIQEFLLDSSAILLINTYLHENDPSAKVAVLGVVSAMVRGTNLRSKRVFIEANGVALLKQIIAQGLESEPTFYAATPQKQRIKAMNLLYDLLFYDPDLDKTYYDLSPFMNTNSKKHSTYLQQKNKITIDQDKQASFNNHLPENSKYKGIITQQVLDQQLINAPLITRILDNKELHNFDTRLFMIRIINLLIQRGHVIYQGLLPYLQQCLQQAIQLNNDDINEPEIELLQNTIAML